MGSPRLHPVILSGGSGTRLWPLSRELYPKQFLPLAGEQTLLQQTALRLDGLDRPGGAAPPLVVCNEAHRFLVAEQLRQVERAPARILLEPVGRNTAPALTAAALHLAAAGEEGALMLVMPADHVIADTAAFHRAVARACELAAAGELVTFGVVPERAETGYGYIRRGEPLGEAAFRLARFVEKPDAATAREYVDSGEYFWNSGMFLMPVGLWLEAIARHRPDIHAACEAACRGARADHDFLRLEAGAFTGCPADSIDYAVMEKVAAQAQDGLRAAVVPLAAGWSDVGAWSALWEVHEKDRQGNVTVGDVLLEDSRNTFVAGNGRLVAAVGVDNLVVVETPDAVLVADRSRVQEVKAVVERLRAAGRDEAVTHRRVHRPWGTYETIDVGHRYQVKRITVNPGAALSLQMHHHRAEHWVVVKGTARVTRGQETFLVTENESTYIPVGVRHRLENPGKFPLEMIEVQSGSYLGEDDIVRFEDHYGRGEDR